MGVTFMVVGGLTIGCVQDVGLRSYGFIKGYVGVWFDSGSMCVRVILDVCANVRVV